MSQSGPSSLIPLNPFDRRARPDPYPVYQYMRTVEPVHKSPVGFWILTRYDDCRMVLTDKRWSHDADRILEPQRGDDDPVDPTVRLVRASVAFSDPPLHARHRRPLEVAMKNAMKGSAARTTRVAHDLVELLREKESGADIMRDYAMPLALVALTDLMGFPSADRGQLQRWSRELIAGIDPGIKGAGVMRASAAATAMVEYLLSQVESSRDGDGAGMLSDLVINAGKLRTWDLIADLTVFLVVGVETSSALIGNAMLALLRNPEQMRKLRDQPSLIDTGLEELIRYDGPIHLTARVADADVLIGRTTIKAGEQAIVLLGAADRDPARFADPDTLNLSRSDNPHLGFGGGVHSCFAAPLAKVLGRVAIGTLLAGVSEIELAGDPVWSETVTVRGLRRLPVTVHP
jgi:cytochrome P450